MEEAAVDPLIARVNALADKLFQQGSIGRMLDEASRCMPADTSFAKYYAWCDEYSSVPDEELPAFGRDLERRLTEALSGNQHAAEIVLDLYGLNECVKGYIDASLDMVMSEDRFVAMRQSRMAKAGLKECFMALSGVGEHQANVILEAFCNAVDALSRDVVDQRAR